jgi:NTP pyrophosphatase (non-canonical NTP hydrolase)
VECTDHPFDNDDSSRDRYNHLSSYSDLSPKGSSEGDSGSESKTTFYTFRDYQDDAGTTAIYPEADTGSPEAITYVILGLVGEAGEVANKYKKVLRDNNGITDLDSLTAIASEIGDVLWYSARLASELGINLSTIAAENFRKLNARKETGTIGGSGDNR